MILYENERSSQKHYIYNQSDENLTFQKHAHYSFEVVFVTDGELECEVGEEKYRLFSGDALLILPGEVHSYLTKESSVSHLTVFSNDLVPEFYNEVKGKRLSKPIFHENDAKNATKELSEISSADIFAQMSLFYKICSRAYSESEVLPTLHGESTTLASMIAFYVQNNYTKNISLRELSREHGYNYTYFSSFFSKTFGQNFSSYVNRFRLQYAAHLLLCSNRDITHIAEESGFLTIRNFNTAFKKEYSLSPSEYREKVNSGQ